MTQKEWFDRSLIKGTRGDTVFDVLEDWKQSQETYEDYFRHCLTATLNTKTLEKVLKYYNENKEDMLDILNFYYKEKEDGDRYGKSG